MKHASPQKYDMGFTQITDEKPNATGDAMTEPEAIERIVKAQEAQTLALEVIGRLLFQLVELQKEAASG